MADFEEELTETLMEIALTLQSSANEIVKAIEEHGSLFVIKMQNPLVIKDMDDAAHGIIEYIRAIAAIKRGMTEMMGSGIQVMVLDEAGLQRLLGE